MTQSSLVSHGTCCPSPGFSGRLAFCSSGGSPLVFGGEHVIAAQLAAYGGVFIGALVYVAYSNYKWKKRTADWEHSSGSMDSVPADAAQRAAARPLSRHRPEPASAAANTAASRCRWNYLHQPEPRKLADTPDGANVHISFAEVAVDLQGRTWVNAEARVYEEPSVATGEAQSAGKGYILTLRKRRDHPLPSLQGDSSRSCRIGP